MSFRVISSTEPITMDGMTFAPFTRYVVPAGPAQTLGRGLVEKSAMHSMSVWNSFHRPFAGQAINGKRLAIYRHAAFGDQLMVTGVAAYIASRWPAAKIDVYCSPQVLELWRGLPVRALPAPLTFDAARSYDHHLFFDQMLEENREPDQECAYDDLFGFAGLSDVPATYKRPHAVLLEEDLASLEQFPWEEKFIVVQLQANNTNRTYPPEQLAQFCVKFVAQYPHNLVLVGLDRPSGILLRFENALAEELDSLGLPPGRREQYRRRLKNLVGALPRFRSLIPLVQQAALVVCPDSSIGHLAAAFPRTPVISLWGLFHPNDRVKYYANHHPLHEFKACPHAPCRNHEFKLPQEKCNAAVNATPGPQTWCNALRAISPDWILARAKEVIR